MSIALIASPIPTEVWVYAAAFNKSVIVIHNEDHQHALKEVDAFASAVAENQHQVVRILKYILSDSLDSF